MIVNPLDTMINAVKLLDLAVGTLRCNRHATTAHIHLVHARNAKRALRDVEDQLEAMPDWRWYFTISSNQPLQAYGETLCDFLKRASAWYWEGIDRARAGTSTKAKETA